MSLHNDVWLHSLCRNSLQHNTASNFRQLGKQLQVQSAMLQHASFHYTLLNSHYYLFKQFYIELLISYISSMCHVTLAMWYNTFSLYYTPKQNGYIGMAQQITIWLEGGGHVCVCVGRGGRTEDKGVKEGYTQLKGNMFHQSSIKRIESITQTRTDLPKVHIFLEKHFLCLIEPSVCTSVIKKTIITTFSIQTFKCQDTVQFKCPQWDSVFPFGQRSEYLCVTAGFHHGVTDICGLLGFYTV